VPSLPALLKLSLLTLSCALIMSGFALAGAAYVRNPALIAAAAGLFLLVALTQPTFLVLLVPGALILHFGYLRPLLRRSYRKRIAQFPSWDLKPEQRA
jgi:hypothetical protein